MIQQRQQMYGALPWAQAGLYGGQAVGMPRGGSGGVVPAASLHVPALVTAKSPAGGSTPRSGLQEVMGLAKDVAGMIIDFIDKNARKGRTKTRGKG